MARIAPRTGGANLTKFNTQSIHVSREYGLEHPPTYLTDFLPTIYPTIQIVQ